MKKVFLSVVLLMAYIGTAQAVKVNFSGTLVEGTPCEINNNRPIDVDFGDNLVVSMVPTKDGTTYIEDIDFDWQCDNLSSGTDIALRFDGAAASFDRELLKINEQKDIALQLYHDSEAFNINSGFLYTYESDYDKPLIQAALVKSSSSSAVVNPGEFTASGTLTVSYP